MDIKTIMNGLGLAVTCAVVVSFISSPGGPNANQAADGFALTRVEQRTPEAADVKRNEIVSREKRRKEIALWAAGFTSTFDNGDYTSGVKSKYDDERDLLVISAAIPFKNFEKVPAVVLTDTLEKLHKQLCKRFASTKIFNSGLTLQLDLRTQADNLSIGSIVASKTDCAA